MPFGRLISEIILQLLNVLFPIILMEFRKSGDDSCICIQSWNAEVPKYSIASVRCKDFSSPQPWKALSPIYLTLSPITKTFRCEQALNAPVPILFSSEGRNTEYSWALLVKALSPIDSTPGEISAVIILQPLKASRPIRFASKGNSTYCNWLHP